MLADDFDQMTAFTAASGKERSLAGLVLQQPVASELAALNFAEDLLHFGLSLLGHDSVTASIVTILSGV